MSRKFHYFGLLVVVAAMVTVGLTNMSRADTFTMSQVTCDADSGISSSYNYTHVVDINCCNGGHASGAGAARTVNGVTFDAIYNNKLVSSVSGTNWSLVPAFGDTGLDTVSWTYSTYVGDIMGALADVRHGYIGSSYHGHALTLSNLTPGAEYVASFYIPCGRTVDVELTTTTGGSYTYYADQYPGGWDTGFVVTDTYIAPAGGSITFSFEGRANELGAFTNYLVPEPSTLALLATGLIGLLCYAWRKRK